MDENCGRKEKKEGRGREERGGRERYRGRGEGGNSLSSAFRTRSGTAATRDANHHVDLLISSTPAITTALHPVHCPLSLIRPTSVIEKDVTFTEEPDTD